MSYDLAVFDKKKAPVHLAEFLKWYEKQTEWEGDYDYNDISHASVNLQRFFEEVKQIFPPMNGEFAPDDQELEDNPDLEERLCDYCIGEDMIYLSFAYSMSGRAYDIIKRAAVFSDVGFFAPGEEEGPVCFDSRYPMILEGEWFPPQRVSDFNSICGILDQMTAKKRSYLYFTDPTGSYIQVGGYKNAFTVERRIYTGIMSYSHQKAGYAASENEGKDSYVMIAQNRVQVKLHQVLSKDAAKQLCRDFFEGQETADFITWTDM